MLLQPGRPISVAPLAGASAQAENSQPTLLTQGKPVEGFILNGRTNSYKFASTPDQYIRLFIEASGLSSLVRVTAPDGRVIRESHVLVRGRMWISLLAQAPGTYYFELLPASGSDPGRAYKLGIEEMSQRTDPDADRIEAEQSLADGDELRGRWTKETLQGAIVKYERAQLLWHAAQDRGGEALALKAIGEVHFKQGDAKKALEYFKKALALSRAGRERGIQVATLNALSGAYSYVGENRQSLNSAEQALSLSRANGDSLEEAQALNNIGWAYFGFSDMKKSLEFFERAITLRRSLKDRWGEAETLLNFGYTHSVLKDTSRALDFYNEALAAWREVGDQLGEAFTLTAIGHLHNLLGEKQQALGMYGPAMRFFQTIGNPYGEAITLNGYAYLYEETGENEKAIEYFSRSLRIAQSLGQRESEAASLNRISVNYYAMGDYQNALDFSAKALAVSQIMADPLMQAYALGNMGRSHEGLGRKQEALAFYRRALALERASGDKGRQADELYSIGHVHESSREPKKALSFYREALPLYRAAGERSGESLTTFSIAHAERELGNLNEARRLIEESLKITESLRADVGGRDLRVSYFASIHQRYEFYIDLLMQLHKQRPGEGFEVEALQASERGRARVLLETLGEAHADLRQGVDPDLLERERALRQELDNALSRQAQQLGAERQEAEAAELANRVNALTRQYEEVTARIKAANPRYAELAQPRQPSVSEIQRRSLDDQTLLLEYALGDERSYLWAVTKTSVTSYELPGRVPLEAAARRLYELLTARQPVTGETAGERQARVAQAEAEYLRQADALSDMILSPVAEKLAGKRLLVVADGALQYVPFGALTSRNVEAPVVSGQIRSEDFSRQPIISRHEVVNLPSAATLLALQTGTDTRQPADLSVAIFADPVFERDDPRVHLPNDARQPEADAQQTQVRDALRDVNTLSGGEVIPRLLASREEADAIAALLPPGEVMKITDFKANHVAATRPDLARYRVIHFATHGILDSQHPERSGIVLSLINERGEAQNGFLSLEDIYNLRLSADLVVLSACNTGLGKDVRGEGFIGLTRGFMYAGAGTVVASLWKVDDEATAELMKLFYEGILRRELTPSAALREAQLAMSRQKRWEAPYYWAGFVIQGQNARLEVHHDGLAQNWQRLAAWCIIPAAVLFMAFYVARLRRRRTLSGPRWRQS